MSLYTTFRVCDCCHDRIDVAHCGECMRDVCPDCAHHFDAEGGTVCRACAEVNAIRDVGMALMKQSALPYMVRK